MSRGFKNKAALQVATPDGRNVALLEWLYFVDSMGREWRTMTDSDGLSTPPIIWLLIPPFGKIWYSGVLHDGAYRGKLEMWSEAAQAWVMVMVDEATADWLIHDAMDSQDASRFEHWVIYIALRWFGWRAFAEDRKALAASSRLPEPSPKQ